MRKIILAALILSGCHCAIKRIKIIDKHITPDRDGYISYRIVYKTNEGKIKQKAVTVDFFYSVDTGKWYDMNVCGCNN
jgi:hypothetical protein